MAVSGEQRRALRLLAGSPLGATLLGSLVPYVAPAGALPCCIPERRLLLVIGVRDWSSYRAEAKSRTERQPSLNRAGDMLRPVACEAPCCKSGKSAAAAG
jgi:hypothetical protein